MFWQIYFDDRNVMLLGDCLFKEVANYGVEKNLLYVHLNRDNFTLKTKIQRLDKDTLIMFDSLIYYRIPNNLFQDLKEYELIDIPTNRLLSNAKTPFLFIHFYKSSKNEPKIRIGDKVMEVQELPLYLYQEKQISESLILLDKDLTVKDLKSIYYIFGSHRIYNVWLGTKKKGALDYHLLQDNFHIWENDLKKYRANFKNPQPPLPPPIHSYSSEEEYLKFGGEKVNIKNFKDFQIIENLKQNKKYLISINSELDLKDYLLLKTLILKKQQTNFDIVTILD